MKNNYQFLINSSWLIPIKQKNSSSDNYETMTVRRYDAVTFCSPGCNLELQTKIPMSKDNGIVVNTFLYDWIIIRVINEPLCIAVGGMRRKNDDD